MEMGSSVVANLHTYFDHCLICIDQNLTFYFKMCFKCGHCTSFWPIHLPHSVRILPVNRKIRPHIHHHIGHKTCFYGIHHQGSW